MTTEQNKNKVIISVRGLEKHFGGGDIKALRGVDTDIHKGEVLVVIGPSGSGKSTFLRCLNLLEMPTAGTITFEGTDTSLVSPLVFLFHTLFIEGLSLHDLWKSGFSWIYLFPFSPAFCFFHYL